MNIQTKKDFEELMFKILHPLRDKYSDGCAFLELGSTSAWYPMDVAKMEAFAIHFSSLIYAKVINKEDSKRS